MFVTSSSLYTDKGEVYRENAYIPLTGNLWRGHGEVIHPKLIFFRVEGVKNILVFDPLWGICVLAGALHRTKQFFLTIKTKATFFQN